MSAEKQYFLKRINSIFEEKSNKLREDYNTLTHNNHSWTNETEIVQSGIDSGKLELLSIANIRYNLLNAGDDFDASDLVEKTEYKKYKKSYETSKKKIAEKVENDYKKLKKELLELKQTICDNVVFKKDPDQLLKELKKFAEKNFSLS